MLLVATSTAALNPSIAGPDQIPVLIELMAKAFSSGSWTLASGLLLSLVVVVLRMFKVSNKVPKEWTPWVVAGMSLLTSVSVGLQTGEEWLQIISTGFAVALVAVGGWETIAKLGTKLLTKWGVLKEPPAIKPPEE